MCLLKGRHLIFGNAGDSRAVFFDGQPHQVTTDHNAKSREERARVEDLGGFFAEGRIFGELEPTRGLGDVEIRRIHMDLLIKSKSKSKSTKRGKSPSPPPSPEPYTEHERSRRSESKSDTSSTSTHKKPDSEAQDKKPDSEAHDKKETSKSDDSKTKGDSAVSNADDSKNGRRVKGLDLAKIEGRRAPDSNPFCSVPYTLSELQEMRSVTEFAPEWSVVSSLPDISHWLVPESTEGSFLVIASDGVWTSLRNDQVCDIVKRSLNEKRGHGFAKAQAAARALCEAAREAPMSYDDTTAIVVWFKN
jgi:serine/threonine protein phosphatase PrpC